MSALVVRRGMVAHPCPFLLCLVLGEGGLGRPTLEARYHRPDPDFQVQIPGQA